MSGPLPAPQTLAEYDQAHPGAAKIILEAFERTTQARIDMQRRTLEIQASELQEANTLKRRGQNGAIAALSIIMTTALGALWIAPNGAGAVVGSLVGAGGIGSIVTAFIYGQRKGAEQEQHREALPPAKPN